jgi:F-type H+-transporting ATPase subunit alpha
LNRGKRIIEVLKQNVFSPMSLADQVTILYAVNNGYMDDVPEEKAKAYEVGFHKFMETSYSALMKTIATTKDLTPESEETLKKAIQLYKQGMVL